MITIAAEESWLSAFASKVDETQILRVGGEHSLTLGCRSVTLLRYADVPTIKALEFIFPKTNILD